MLVLDAGVENYAIAATNTYLNISESYAEGARKMTKSTVKNQTIDFIIGDVESLLLKDRKFDLGLCGSIENLPEPYQALSELIRVTK